MSGSRKVVLALCVLGALGACGGGEEPDAAPDGGNGDAPSEVTVLAADFSFSPSAVTVPAGEEVRLTFTNNGQSPHTFTSQDLGVDVQADPGASEEAVFTLQDGSAEFQCNLHPQMQGTVTVEGAEAGAGGGTSDDGAEKENDAYDY